MRPLMLMMVCLAIAGCGEDNQPERSPTVPTAPASNDTVRPVVTITVPTTNPSYSTSASTVSIGGTASDNVGVVRVTWSSNSGATGTANGTTAWSTGSIALQAGSNVLTVTAHDTVGNTTTANLTVVYNANTNTTDCSLASVLCVDDTPGATQEFSTIEAAADVTQAGDTVVVHDGNYAGFRITRSGTPTSPIVFRANGSGVVIDRDGPTVNGVTRRDGMRLQNVSYVVIDGFYIRDVSERCIAARGATPAEPMNGLVIRNNTCTNGGIQGFYLSQVANSLIENNSISNIRGAGGTEGHGIYLANAGSDNTIIRGNTIFDNKGSASAQGIHFNGDLSIGGDGLISGLIVENNILFNNSNNGLNMDGVQDSTIQNNLIYGNGRNALRGYRGDAADGPARLKIINNTFVTSTASGWAIKLSDHLGGHTIFNNILLGTSGSISADNINVVSNHNAVVNRFSFDNDATVVQLSTWQAQTRSDGSSFVSTAASLFANAAGGDYRLAGTSPAIDAGSASFNGVSAPTYDLSGTARPQRTATDIGAFELN